MGLVALIGAGVLPAQERKGTLAGRVVDAGSAEPLNKVEVMLWSLSDDGLDQYFAVTQDLAISRHWGYFRHSPFAEVSARAPILQARQDNTNFVA